MSGMTTTDTAYRWGHLSTEHLTPGPSWSTCSRRWTRPMSSSGRRTWPRSWVGTGSTRRTTAGRSGTVPRWQPTPRCGSRTPSTARVGCGSGPAGECTPSTGGAAWVGGCCRSPSNGAWSWPATGTRVHRCSGGPTAGSRATRCARCWSTAGMPSFRDHWGSAQTAPESWHDHWASRSARMGVSSVALDPAGRPLAYALCAEWVDRELYVNIVGTVPSARGRGLAPGLPGAHHRTGERVGRLRHHRAARGLGQPDRRHPPLRAGRLRTGQDVRRLRTGGGVARSTCGPHPGDRAWRHDIAYQVRSLPRRLRGHRAG